MGTFWDKIKTFWSKMDPDNQRKIAVVGVISLVIILGLWGYKVTHDGNTPSKKNGEKTYSKISLDAKNTEKTLFAQTREQIGKQNDELAALRAELNKVVKAQETQAKAQAKDQDKGNGSDGKKKDDTVSLPFPPPPIPLAEANAQGKNPPRFSSVQGEKTFVPEVVQKKVVGGIGIVSVAVSNEPKDDASKKKPSVYLPPSFMKATLLTGAIAPTTSSGANNPVPLLLRIKDLAVLPNSVKANLKGCFVIAEGHGNLGDERVHVRLTTLSCIASNGTAVIDQPINGFLQDEDGKVGLKGNVVAPNLASTLARSALAGFFGGVGDAFQEASTTVSSGAYGTTELWTDTDTNNLIRAGVGGGVSTMADDLRKFYLELASQAVPGIEIGSAKKVEMIISKGVELSIKDLDNTIGEI